MLTKLQENYFPPSPPHTSLAVILTLEYLICFNFMSVVPIIVSLKLGRDSESVTASSQHRSFWTKHKF